MYIHRTIKFTAWALSTVIISKTDHTQNNNF